MKTTTTILLSIICFARCSNDVSEIDINEVNSITVVGETIPVSEEILAPRKILMIKDGYLLFDSVDKNAFLKFVSYSTKDVLSYGKIGRGEGEFITPLVHRNGDNSVIITSMNSNKIIEFSKNSITDKDLELKNRKQFTGVNYLAQIDDNLFLTNSSSENQTTIINNKTDEEEHQDYYPFSVGGMSEFEKANIIFDSNLSYSNSDNSLFILFKYYPYAMTVDIKSETVISKVKLKGGLTDNSYAKNDMGVVEFINPTLFYTYSINKSQDKWGLFQNSTRKTLSERGVKSEIHRFTESGELKERIILDRTIYHFDLSHDNKYIYALALNSEGLCEIVKYSMKK